MKENLKKLTLSIFVLFFSSAYFFSTLTFASKSDYDEEYFTYNDYVYDSEEYLSDNEDSDSGYYSDTFMISEERYNPRNVEHYKDLIKLKPKKFRKTYRSFGEDEEIVLPTAMSDQWSDLCRIVEKIVGLSYIFLPNELNNQYIAICENLYLLFKKESNLNLKAVLECLKSQDKTLNCKLSKILLKKEQRRFNILYQKVMATLKVRATDNKSMKKQDTLFVLSYVYQLAIKNLKRREIVLTTDEIEDAKILLGKIFEKTPNEVTLNKIDPLILGNADEF